MKTTNVYFQNDKTSVSGPPPERPDKNPHEHDRPDIDEIEENQPIEQPEIDQQERPQPDIDEIDQGDVEPEINN